MKLPEEVQPAPLEVGDLVDCRPKGGDLHYPAKVESVNPNGSYDLEYDGDTENSVRRPMLLAQAVYNKVIAGQRARAEALMKRLMKIHG
jgi:hypothetical protein